MEKGHTTDCGRGIVDRDGCVKGDVSMCQDDVIILMWCHQEVTRVTHFFHFRVELACTNLTHVTVWMTHGNPYSDMAL
jgi:hypothetical protein